MSISNLPQVCFVCVFVACLFYFEAFVWFGFVGRCSVETKPKNSGPCVCQLHPVLSHSFSGHVFLTTSSLDPSLTLNFVSSVFLKHTEVKAASPSSEEKKEIYLYFRDRTQTSIPESKISYLFIFLKLTVKQVQKNPAESNSRSYYPMGRCLYVKHHQRLHTVW